MPVSLQMGQTFFVCVLSTLWLMWYKHAPRDTSSSWQLAACLL
jgi:hypothetical protein